MLVSSPGTSNSYILALPMHPASELISFSQMVGKCRQGLCYLMPYKCHLKATSKSGLPERFHLGVVVR